MMRIPLLIIGITVGLSMPHLADAARLYTSGCEFQGDSPGNMTTNLEWDRGGAAAASTQVSGTVKRSGQSSCAAVATSAGWADFSHQFRSVADTNPVYARFYLNIGVMPQETADIANFGSGVRSNSLHGLILASDGTLKLVDQDGSTVLATYSTPLSTNTWYRIEMYYDKLTTGNATVRLDGTQIMNVTSLTGGSVNSFSLNICGDGALCGGDVATIATLYFDDIAINDTNGASQTSWPGSGRVVHLQPNAAGDANGCTAGDVTSVDEVTPDDVGTICTLTTDGGGDVLDVNVVSASSVGILRTDSVSLIAVGVREGAASAASETWNARIKSASSGTVTSGTATSHDDSTYRSNGDVAPRNHTLVSYTDPTTGAAWTVTGPNSIENMQIGITSTDANPDINVSTLGAVVEYIEGPKARGSLNGGRIILNGGRFILQGR